MTSTHVLKPGAEVFKQQRLVNMGVWFENPGVYTIEPWTLVYGPSGLGSKAYCPRPIPATLRVVDYDHTRRAKDIAVLVAAYKAGGAPPDSLPFTPYLQGMGNVGIVRVLTFFRDPGLIEFFLDVIEDTDTNGYAWSGLLKMPAAEPVIQAFEKRLACPEARQLEKLIWHCLDIKYPGVDDPAQAKVIYQQRRAAEAQLRQRLPATVPATTRAAAPEIEPAVFVSVAR